RSACANSSAASNPTSRFRVKRCTPSIAPRESANARTRSSAASLTDAITRTSRADGCESSHARAAAIRPAARSEIMISREAGIDAARLDAAPQHYRLPRGSDLARGHAALFPQPLRRQRSVGERGKKDGLREALLSGELLSQVHRTADADPARGANRREYADVGAMMERG